MKYAVAIAILFLAGCGPRMDCSEWGYKKLTGVSTGTTIDVPVCLGYNIDGKPARLVQ